MKVGTPEKGRLIFIDVLRVISAGAVVLMHTISGVLNGGFDMTGYERRRCAFLAIMDATAWCVPIFLMISGYLLLNPSRKVTWKEAFFRFCKRILLALAIFGIPYSLLELVGTERAFRIDMIPKAIWATATGKSWAHMWYLYLILLLYAVTPILKWILEKIPGKVVSVLLLLLFVFTSLLPFGEALLGARVGIALPQWLIYLFYYLMGYLFITRKRECFTGEGALCLVLFVIVILLQMASRFLPGYELNLAYAYPLTALTAVLLFDGCLAAERKITQTQPQKAKNGRMVTYCQKLSGLTFGIYLIHPVFLNYFYKFKGISIMDFRFWVGVPLFFLISFVGAALITWILRMLSPMRKYVL